MAKAVFYRRNSNFTNTRKTIEKFCFKTCEAPDSTADSAKNLIVVRSLPDGNQGQASLENDGSECSTTT
ncbi:MAG: hypothetical protein COT00_00220 [Candidatus Omnitrophica bacterium CG07_land_8_20_14_0_80_50_8]|nr:MAG: hypothetical protein COT00_00220 [Candidatus Omnitrophica bacterium CG07_land_8_20_14_0_80_50_8]